MIVQRHDALGAALHYARTRRGLQQGDIAVKVRVGRPDLSKWEHGKTMPSVRQLFALVHALGYDVALIPREADR